jgi:hypothetical protein
MASGALTNRHGLQARYDTALHARCLHMTPGLPVDCRSNDSCSGRGLSEVWIAVAGFDMTALMRFD